MIAMRATVGSVRTIFASVLIALAAWVVRWQVLWGGLSGSDTAYHLHLARWVADSFPLLHWWYRWDAMGVSYREGYPLAPSWLTVAVAQINGLSLDHAMQVVQFAINPLCAIGIYAFCAWRMGRPLVGLVAGVMFLLSPIAYTFLLDWGFYASQMGTVLVMPSVIAIDVFCEEWQAERSGWTFRLSALCTLVLITATGLVSPTIVGAPLAAIVAYTLAVRGGWRRQLRWLLVVTPILGVAWLAMAAFYVGPLNDYLGLIASRHPAPSYSPLLFPHWDFVRMLQLQPIRAMHVEDQASFVLAVWIPAMAGALALWDARVRVMVALAITGFVITSVPVVDQVLYSTPIPTLLNNRVGITLVQFTVPLLAGFGFMATLPTAAGFLMRRLHSPRLAQVTVAAALSLIGLVLVTVDVGANFAGARDIWARHLPDPCGDVSTNSLCRSSALSTSFNVFELQAACRAPDRSLRHEVPICAAIKDIDSPTWDGTNDAVIARTVSDCRSGSRDAVCSARYQTFEEQVIQTSQWRPVQVGCFLPGCQGPAPASLFATPPQRAVLDAHSGQLLMAFHDLTGGGQFYTYNFQDISSPELSDYMKNTMLETTGTAVAKSELASITGADAVVLAANPAAASDYAAMGWQKLNAEPPVYAPPQSSGLASEWPAANTVLVMGRVELTSSHPYNDIFQRATAGMIPFQSGWLVRARSAYIDDYSDSELAGYSSLLLLGYQYHDAGTAWQRLDTFVRNGGRLYVETGWQYTDPDWNQSGYPVLPVSGLSWSALDPRAPVILSGGEDPSFGAMTYQGAGWGASGARGVRAGAEPLVTVGGRVVAARWSVGRGRVVWSGMNLIAHSEVSKSADEDAFVASQFAWLFQSSAEFAAPASALEPTWVGDDEAHLALEPAAGPTAVLFKESVAPGWSAELRWPGGVRSVNIEPSEMDFMLVRLESVPSGSTLVFHYGPAPRVYLWWSISGLALLLAVLWALAPAPYRSVWGQLTGFIGGFWERFGADWEDSG